MGSFTSVRADESWYTVEEVEKAIRFNGGVLASYGFGFTCPEYPDDGLKVGVWSIKLVNRQGMGNHGSYVAIATTPETYKFQMGETLKGLRATAEAVGCDIESWSKKDTVECGPMMLTVCLSPLWKGGMYMGEDDLFKYYCYPHGNHVRLGDDRYRVWAKLK
jgi:hypothetical protein